MMTGRGLYEGVVWYEGVLPFRGKYLAASLVLLLVALLSKNSFSSR